jgi:hypothetical protein
LKLNDEVKVRLISAENADEPSRRESSVPASRVEAGGRVTQCSFCGEMRRIEPKGSLTPGVAGATVFICTRCLVFAERMLHSGLEQLFHLTKTTSQTCSFCQTEHVPECATGQAANMCRACVDMMMT